MSYNVEHGSIEAIPFTLTAPDGTPVTDASTVTCYLVPGGADWETGTGAQAVATAPTGIGYMTTGAEPVGPYDLHAKVTAPPETPVKYVGRVNVT